MNIYSTIEQNKWKTWLIMFLFIIFITTVAYVFGEASGYGLSYAGIGLIMAGFMSLVSYYFSDKLVLATSGAKRIEKKDNPQLFRTVENLTIAAGLPMPKIYIINDPSPNAFATGRDPNHAIVAATTGILERLNKIELEGVIAHELSHVKNYDVRLMAIVAVLVGFVAILADIFMRSMWYGGMGGRDNRRAQGIFILLGIIFAILSPIVATLIQLAVSRKREFLADASGALLTRYPEGLASALEKIAAYPKPMRNATNATAHLFIANPFKEKSTTHWFASLFNTHPPVTERIQILRSM